MPVNPDDNEVRTRRTRFDEFGNYIPPRTNDPLESENPPQRDYYGGPAGTPVVEPEEKDPDPVPTPTPTPTLTPTSSGGAIPAPPRLSISDGNIPPAGVNELSLEAMISQATRDALSGVNAPFGPKELTAIRARLFQDTSGKAKASKEALNRDMIRRGLSRSGIAVEQGAGIDRAASADYTTNLRETLVAAAQQNYQAKATALQQAQQQLDSYRSYRLNSARTANEFTIAQSQIDLAYARLKQDWNSLQSQLANTMQIAQMGNENALTIALLNLQNQNGGGNPYYGGGG